jgi:hypothetical protein
MLNSTEAAERLENLLKMCVLYQAIIVDIDHALSEIDLILACTGFGTVVRNEAISSTIDEAKSKYLPKLVEIKALTKRIIDAAETLKEGTVIH